MLHTLEQDATSSAHRASVHLQDLSEASAVAASAEARAAAVRRCISALLLIDYEDVRLGDGRAPEGADDDGSIVPLRSLCSYV